MSEQLTVEEALKELREMFPMYRIAIYVEVGPTANHVPHYWIKVKGQHEPSIGVETLSAAMAEVRKFHKEQSK